MGTGATITSFTRSSGRITGITWNNHGSGYEVGDLITITQGTRTVSYQLLTDDVNSGALVDFADKALIGSTHRFTHSLALPASSFATPLSGLIDGNELARDVFALSLPETIASDDQITLTLTGGASLGCGQFIMGKLLSIGESASDNADISGLDFSRIETDILGNLTTETRAAVDIQTFDVILETDAEIAKMRELTHLLRGGAAGGLVGRRNRPSRQLRLRLLPKRPPDLRQRHRAPRIHRAAGSRVKGNPRRRITAGVLKEETQDENPCGPILPDPCLTRQPRATLPA